jgi:hypothetical protein
MRRALTLSTLVTIVAAASALVGGQAKPKFETFTATTANLATGAGQTIKINVFQWSPDKERERLVAAVPGKGDTQLQEALKTAPSAGYIWTDESLGYTLRYAYRIALPTGGERIILATERLLGSWSGTPWKVANEKQATKSEFTLIELRLNAKGQGEGKMSQAAAVHVDAQAKTIALEGYETAPTLLRNVRRVADAASN